MFNYDIPVQNNSEVSRMKNITITEAEAQLQKILDETVLEHEVFTIDGSYGKSVIISESSFNALINKAQNPVLSIRKRRAPYKSLKERFKDYNGDYKPTEIDWGSPVGKEIW